MEQEIVSFRLWLSKASRERNGQVPSGMSPMHGVLCWLALGRQRLLVTNNFGNGWQAAPLLHVVDEERGHPHFLKMPHFSGA